MSLCSICSAETPTDGVLIDGSVFHNRCPQKLKDNIESLKLREGRLLAELQKPLSLMENISIFLFQSRQTELLASKQNLVSGSLKQLHRLPVEKAPHSLDRYSRDDEVQIVDLRVGKLRNLFF